MLQSGMQCNLSPPGGCWDYSSPANEREFIRERHILRTAADLIYPGKAVREQRQRAWLQLSNISWVWTLPGAFGLSLNSPQTTNNNQKETPRPMMLPELLSSVRGPPVIPSVL